MVDKQLVILGISERFLKPYLNSSSNSLYFTAFTKKMSNDFINFIAKWVKPTSKTTAKTKHFLGTGTWTIFEEN